MTGTLKKIGAVALMLFAGTALAATPNMHGPWQAKNPASALKADDGSAPPLLPDAQAMMQKNAATAGKAPGDPMARCLPPGVSRLFLQPYPFTMIQGKKLSGIVFEWNHLSRVIYMTDTRFEPLGPAYLGQSIGHWQGTTLVVDTNGYNDTTWLDDAGLPHSDQLHTIERFHLTPSGGLDDAITFDDPKTFSHDWTATIHFQKKPGVIVKEDYCLGRTGQGVSQ